MKLSSGRIDMSIVAYSYLAALHCPFCMRHALREIVANDSRKNGV